MPAPRDSESGVPLQIYAMIKLLSSSSLYICPLPRSFAMTSPLMEADGN